MDETSCRAPLSEHSGRDVRVPRDVEGCSSHFFMGDLQSKWGGGGRRSRAAFDSDHSWCVVVNDGGHMIRARSSPRCWFCSKVDPDRVEGHAGDALDGR